MFKILFWAIVRIFESAAKCGYYKLKSKFHWLFAGCSRLLSLGANPTNYPQQFLDILPWLISPQEMLVHGRKICQNCQVADKYIDTIFFIKNIYNQAYYNILCQKSCINSNKRKYMCWSNYKILTGSQRKTSRC